jgi:hypothetical protein
VVKQKGFITHPLETFQSQAHVIENKLLILRLLSLSKQQHRAPKGEKHMAKANPVQLETILKNIQYPVNKDTLIEQAEQQGIDEQNCQTLRQLPNQHYRSAHEVIRALGSQQGNAQPNANAR